MTKDRAGTGTAARGPSALEEAVLRHAREAETSINVVRAYYRVRQALGYVGLAFPVALVLAGIAARTGVEPSVSDFFHTVSRDIFVGALFSIGLFLIVYEGHDRQPGETLTDNWLATVAGVAAIGVALFPNESPTGDTVALMQALLGVGWSPPLHYLFALVFFYTMAHFCLFRFAKTRDPVRRRTYLVCGWVVLASAVALAVASWWRRMGPPPMTDLVNRTDLIFWIEAAGVWAFSWAWVVKGRGEIGLLSRRADPGPQG